jgi:TorA maturation chaperone TorD
MDEIPSTERRQAMTEPWLSSSASPSGSTACGERFAALARLFREPSRDQAVAVRTLLTPCTSGHGQNCALLDAAVLTAGERATQWFEHAGSLAVLEAEHYRLFESRERLVDAPLPRLSPCAATHLEGDPDDIRADISRLYSDLGFPGSDADLRPECPCHIANELDFVAHCLSLDGAGLDGAAEASTKFIADHLFPWGIVFAAAVSAVAEHPVTRFAGLALEGLLFCEAGAQFALYAQRLRAQS